MNRKEAAELLPIIKAFSEGKVIQVEQKNGWVDADWVNVSFDDYPSYKYRVKPEHKYRPFKDAEECWQEMQKHQPFGWLKDKKTNAHELLKLVAPKDGVIDQYTCVFKRCVFADGTPFGIKEGTDD